MSLWHHAFISHPKCLLNILIHIIRGVQDKKVQLSKTSMFLNHQIDIEMHHCMEQWFQQYARSKMTWSKNKTQMRRKKKSTESKLWPHVRSSPIRICKRGWPRQQGSSVLFYHKHFRIPIIQSDRTSSTQQVEYHYPSTLPYYLEHIMPKYGVGAGSVVFVCL